MFVNEKDIEFCVNAIKLIKENGATYIKKDNDDLYIEICLNPNDEVVIAFNEDAFEKANKIINKGLNGETIKSDGFGKLTGKNHSFVRTAKGIVRDDIDLMNMTDDEKRIMIDNDYYIFENAEEFNGNHLVEYAFINPDDGKECCLGYITKDKAILEGKGYKF